MKTLSFSAVEILPSLLNKTKSQTIRPLFDSKTGLPRSIGVIEKGEPFGKREVNIIGNNEKPRFKIGEKVRFYWKQRSKYYSFCRKCGEEMLPDREHFDKNHIHCGINKPFNKSLGEVEITEVFEISMKANVERDVLILTKDGQKIDIEDHVEIPDMDGFFSPLDFNDYFLYHYDLKIPKKFAVYRFRWI